MAPGCASFPVVPPFAERMLREEWLLLKFGEEGDLAKLFVGDDEEIYGRLLDAKGFARFHLSPRLRRGSATERCTGGHETRTGRA